ncbi:hypothetical protein ACP70R_032770 [Stipagrostis hirtigluma subsp. patula]
MRGWDVWLAEVATARMGCKLRAGAGGDEEEGCGFKPSLTPTSSTNPSTEFLYLGTLLPARQHHNTWDELPSASWFAGAPPFAAASPRGPTLSMKEVAGVNGCVFALCSKVPWHRYDHGGIGCFQGPSARCPLGSCLFAGRIVWVEALQMLIQSVLTNEEDLKLKYLKDDPFPNLCPIEALLKAILDVPFAFKRMKAMLYISRFHLEINQLRMAYATFEEISSRLFHKVLEAVLNFGNFMSIIVGSPKVTFLGAKYSSKDC